jgi:hypothetical protein
MKWSLFSSKGREDRHLGEPRDSPKEGKVNLRGDYVIRDVYILRCSFLFSAKLNACAKCLSGLPESVLIDTASASQLGYDWIS